VVKEMICLSFHLGNIAGRVNLGIYIGLFRDLISLSDTLLE
jgi:hypothetical protein